MLLTVKTLLDRGLFPIIFPRKVHDGIIGPTPKVNQYLLDCVELVLAISREGSNVVFYF